MDKLSKKEKAIMQVLWDADKPLTVTEICDYAKASDSPLKPATVQVLMTKLLKKETVEVAKYTQTQTAFARAFTPCFTAEDYAIYEIKQIMSTISKDKRSSFIAAFMGDDVNDKKS